MKYPFFTDKEEHFPIDYSLILCQHMFTIAKLEWDYLISSSPTEKTNLTYRIIQCNHTHQNKKFLYILVFILFRFKYCDELHFVNIGPIEHRPILGQNMEHIGL